MHTSIDQPVSAQPVVQPAQQYIDAIARDGYCIFPGALSPELIRETFECVQVWLAKTKDQKSHMPGPYLNNGTNADVVLNLQAKDYTFLKTLFASKDLNDTLMYFLNDKWHKKIPLDEPNYILNSFIARSPKDRQPLHIDAYMPYQGMNIFNMQCIYVLEDMTLENGCTLVVPGSHLSGEYCDQSAVKDAVPIEAKAGDIVLWDGRIWHGTLPNNTDGTRWVLVAHFCRWWIKQIFNIKGAISQEILDQLTNSQKAVLGLCSLPYNNELEGVDIRGGYERLDS